MVAAVGFSIFYQREAWCRYLCPLGNLAAVYSLPATVNVRANPSVCATYCTTHECHKGSETIAGCPVFHHPLYARDSHFCKLCFNCLKSCPHGSARLYLRMPLQSIWRQSDLSDALVPFSLFVFFISLFMLASRSATWTSTGAGFTMIVLMAVGLAAVFKTSLPGLLSKEADPDPALASRVSFALLILGWGPAMAFHLEHVPGLESLWLHAAPGSFMARHFPSGEVSLLLVLQVATIVFAWALAAIALWRIRIRFQEQGMKPPTGRWRILQLFCLIYLAAALALVLPGGVFW
jgi:polyferredoxin